MDEEPVRFEKAYGHWQVSEKWADWAESRIVELEERNEGLNQRIVELEHRLEELTPTL